MESPTREEAIRVAIRLGEEVASNYGYSLTHIPEYGGEPWETLRTLAFWCTELEE